MERKGQKRYALALAAMLMFAAVLTAFLALRTTAATINLQNPLDFRGENDSYSNAAFGYAWDGDTKTLTLSDFSMRLNTAQYNAIFLPAGATIYLEEGSENEILLPQSDTVREIFYGVRCEGDLTIKGAGSLSVKLAQSATRLYGIYTEGNLTVDGSIVEVETAAAALKETESEAKNRSVGILVAGQDGVFLAKGGASVFAFSGGVNQTKAGVGGNVDAYGIAASKVTVQNATAFGKVGASVNEGSGSLITAGARADLFVIENGAVTAQNENDFSAKTPALWGAVAENASLIVQNADLHDSVLYEQIDSTLPVSVGTQATFKAYEGKTYEGPEALSSPYSEYTFLGWFDEKGKPYRGELGKTYTAKWQKGNTPVFYGTLDFSENAPSQSDSFFGYAWDSESKTLTLSGLCLYAPEGGAGLVLPAGATVICETGTISEIRADGLTQGGINAGVYAQGLVTFKGQGTLYAKGGTVPPMGTNAACGIYGSFTLTGPTLHLFGGELDFYGSVGFYAPIDATVAFESGSLHAYGKGRAGMLGENATFTAPQKATIKAGDESADLKLDGFTRSCSQKYLSVFVETVQNQGDQPQTKDGFLRARAGAFCCCFCLSA
ncbi:MAG: hypothetical protein J6R40_05060 [Clostridia bacterium]|nr:hypothetical protein [Clostridia bacterium]